MFSWENRSSDENSLWRRRIWKKSDCLVIRTCGRFRLYLRRIFFLLLFFSTMFVTRRERHCYNHIDWSTPFAMAGAFFSLFFRLSRTCIGNGSSVCVGAIVIEIHCLLKMVTLSSSFFLFERTHVNSLKNVVL